MPEYEDLSVSLLTGDEWRISLSEHDDISALRMTAAYTIDN